MQNQTAETSESMTWTISEQCLPIWSRLRCRNQSQHYRNLPITKIRQFHIEIEDRLWSLWGTLHPAAPVFSAQTRNHQYLACYVLACCAASVYQLLDWNSHLLDTIVISGDNYFSQSIKTIKQRDYNLSLEDLNLDCNLANLKFQVHIEYVAFGKLYQLPQPNLMNLSKALIYFFSHFEFGILQVTSLRRALAIGLQPQHNGGYFMYDCQAKDHPLFSQDQGASYLLRTRHLQTLLYCIVVTLNVHCHNVEFALHKVEMVAKDENEITKAKAKANDN